jgi:hypothetical protein
MLIRPLLQLSKLVQFGVDCTNTKLEKTILAYLQTFYSKGNNNNNTSAARLDGQSKQASDGKYKFVPKI